MAISPGMVLKLAQTTKKHWKKIVPAVMGIIVLPLAMFSTSYTVMATVPAIEQGTIRIYISAANEVGEGKTFINFKDLIAIDAVRHQQNFKNVKKAEVKKLAEMFIQANTKVTNYDLSKYKSTVQALNQELGVSVDWREIAMVDALLSKEKFNKSNTQIMDLAKKFVRIDRIPYEEVIEEEVTVRKVKRTWRSIFPWLGDYFSQKLGWGYWEEEEYYETEIREKVITKYREGKEVISYEKVLQNLGYNSDMIPEFFKNKSKISENMQKSVTTYTTKSLDSVLTALGMTTKQKRLVRNYRDIGLAVIIGGGGGNFSGTGESAPASASEFIERVVPGAQKSQKKYGVFSSIIIAQAILESGWGSSGLTARANNLFGVKADSSWAGAFVEMETREVYSGNEVMIMARFRAYESWSHSIEDHGLFLVENSRYAQYGLFKAKDYIGQAYALKEAGYATDPNYPFLLISIIQEYGLYKYDKVQ